MTVALHGRVTLAAAAAGMTGAAGPARIKATADADAAFAAELAAAHDYYKEHLEWELVDLGRRRDNVLAYFGALKRELPHLYIDRAVTANLDVSVSTHVDGAELSKVLAELARVVAPETRDAMRTLASVSASDTSVIEVVTE